MPISLMMCWWSNICIVSEIGENNCCLIISGISWLAGKECKN